MGSFHFTTSAEYNAPGFYETATPTTNAAFSFNTQNAHATGSFGNQGFLDRSQSSYHAWYPQGAESVSQPQQQYTQGQPQQQIGTRSTQIQPQQQSTNYKSQIEWHKAACKALLAVRRDKFEAGFGKQLDQWDEASSRYVEGTPAYNQMAAGYLDWYIGTYKRMSEELGVSQHIYPNDADSDSDEDDDEGYPPAAAEGSKAASTNKDKWVSLIQMRRIPL